jgi:error-prone DNA polymerase
MASLTEPPPYVPLWVKSGYSFLEGSSMPDMLVDQAHALGMTHMALTDRDGMYGAVRAHMRAKTHGTRILHGAQVTTDFGTIVFLVCDRTGWASLCQLLTRARMRCPKGKSLALIGEVCVHNRGLIALCPDSAPLTHLRDAFDDRLYALVARHLRSDEIRHEDRLRTAARHVGVPVVASNEVLYHHRSRRPLQDVLTCIRHGCTIATAGRRTRPNAEHALLTAAEMYARFADDPMAVERTRDIAARCNFSLADLRYRYPTEHTPENTTAHTWLRTLTLEKARIRFEGDIPEDIRAQIEKELGLIEELDYGGYFLTMYEIVEFCRAHNILCQGRGSAANSLVCFALGITSVDPRRVQLLFERFLSRERAEPPDIDLDIEHARREEVIQYMYTRYGRDRAAMVANFIRYRGRSALRDVGKALGVTQTELDAIARQASHWDDTVAPDAYVRAGIDINSRTFVLLRELTAQIAEMPRHLSIHPGGFLLGHEPVTSLVPVEPATMEGRTVIQWDKYDVEDLGLFKVDLLGLGALTVVHKCFDLLRAHEAIDLDMTKVPDQDTATFDMVCAGDTVGVFQIESRAQMAMLPRLRPRTYYDIVIEVAIVRPGPIQGGMVHPYLKRRQGIEAVTYPHPCVEEVLKKTLGVSIFQEQVMRLAMVAAGYTSGEADQLRRDMGAWRSSGRIEQHREKMVTGMLTTGLPRDFAEQVFAQVLGFGEYGFPESHAASFALIAYVTAWMKCHYPAAYVCAMINAQPMGFYSVSTLLEDARRHGVVVRPVDVNHSAWDATLERVVHGTNAVRMGLRSVSGLRKFERLSGVKYTTVEHFARTSGVPRNGLIALAEAGAFGSMVSDRREALWAVHGVAARLGLPLDADGDEPATELVALSPYETIAWDHQSSSHSSRGHPMERYRDALTTAGVPDAATLNAMRDNTTVRYVGMVICRQRPGTASGVVFFTLEDEHGLVNLVVWSTVFEQHAFVGRTASVLEVHGRIQRADGVVHVVADTLVLPTWLDTPVTTFHSRDFH